MPDRAFVRHFLAFAAAVLVAAAPALLFSIQAFAFGVLVALAHVVLLALPAYLVLRRRRWPIGWLTAIVAGALVGGVPEPFYSYWLLGQAQTGAAPYPFLAWVSDTWRATAVFGALGALGGAVFRAVLGTPG